MLSSLRNWPGAPHLQTHPWPPHGQTASALLLGLSTQSQESGYLSWVLKSAGNLRHLNCRFIHANGAVDVVESYICPV